MKTTSIIKQLMLFTCAIFWGSLAFAQNADETKSASIEDLISSKKVTVYESAEESLRFSALVMAGQTGMQPSRAYDVLKFQQDFAVAVQEHLLPTNRVADYSVLPAPAIGAVVRLTAGPSHPAETALAKFDNVVIKRDAKFSLADQFYRVEAITTGLRNLGIKTYMVVPGADQTTVQLPEQRKASIENIARAAGEVARTMDQPSIWPGIGMMEKSELNIRASTKSFSTADIKLEYLPAQKFELQFETGAEIGGSELYNNNLGGLLSKCTSSFTTFRGVLTAGHCLDRLGFNGISFSVSHYFCCSPNTLFPNGSYQGYHGDSGLLTNSNGYYPYFWVSPTGISYQQGSNYAAINQTLCNFGRNKGFNSCNHRYRRWVNLGNLTIPTMWLMEMTNGNTAGGDSGGPYYSGGYGYGLHTASDGIPGSNMYMTPLPFALYAHNTSLRY